MRNRLLAYIIKHNLIVDTDKILLAVSGGKDSVAMAHLFSQLDFHFDIAHCNFKLRGEESDLDESFVKQLAVDLGVKVFTTTFNVKNQAKKMGISIQMAARELRYQWFNDLSEKNTYSKIATAHQKDDNIETLLIKKSRKASLGALRGIPIKNGKVIRPMSCFEAQEIENYLVKNAISFRYDTSNDSLKYQRNNIRHTVIPNLKKAKLLEEIENNKIEYQKLQSLVTSYLESCWKLEDGSMVFPKSIVRSQYQWQEILYECLKYYGPFPWKDVFSLMTAKVGKKIFNNDYQLISERDGLHLSKIFSFKNEQTLVFNHTKKLAYPYMLAFDSYLMQNYQLESDSRIHALDFNKLTFPLKIRKWQNGDKFTPLGMGGRKKVSDFLIDKKLTTKQKQSTLVLCSSDDIVCVLGHRIDEHYKLVPDTEKVYIVKPLNLTDE